MPKLRLPISLRRRGPWLALGVAATLVALPGVASADAGSGALPGSSSDPLSGAASGLIPGGSGPNLGGGGSLPGSQNQGNAGTNAADTSAASSASSGSPSPQQQIQSALEQAGVSAKCADSVQNDLMQLITDIPTSVQAIIDTLKASGGSGSPSEITAALQDLLSGKVPSGSTGTGTTSGSSAPSTPPVAQDLQKLVTDFVANCIPAPPSGLPSMPSSPSSPGTGQQQPQAQAASQPTTQPAAQPVKYPGYAATGGIATSLRPAGDQRSSDPVPLSVLGGLVLVSTATAVGVRARVRRGGR